PVIAILLHSSLMSSYWRYRGSRALPSFPTRRSSDLFVQVAVPSRTDIRAYDELTHQVERLAWDINDRWGTRRWRPVRLIKRSLSDRKSTRLNSSHVKISYAVFCLKKKTAADPALH